MPTTSWRTTSARIARPIPDLPHFLPRASFPEIMGHTGCGRRSDDTLECWGGSTRTAPLRVPTGRFRQISADGSQVCGVRVDGTVACGGYRSDWIVFE